MPADYTFKLRCDKQWRDVHGLSFEALRETRSATCPHGRSVSGIRVHRGFQDWGSVDTYEFQLQCLEDEAEAGARRAQPRGLGGVATLSDLSELLAMGADEAYQLVSSLLNEAPNANAANAGGASARVEL